MLDSYFLNVNYVCNERCTFCAANLANGGVAVRDRPKGLTLEDVDRFFGPDAPLSNDVVSLAGGEPTLHPDLLGIVRRCASNNAAITLFTNGIKLADAEYAAGLVAAGVTRFEIGLFGSTAESHEAITRRSGSFEQTTLALDVLCRLRKTHTFAVEVRLLVSRSGVVENAAICRMLAARMPTLDAVSLHRMILSRDAEAADAAISWEDARDSVNECAAIIREAGYQLRFEAIPLCVFNGENADHVMWELGTRTDAHSPGIGNTRLHYLDPFVAVGEQVGSATSLDVALPSKCLACDYLSVCGRVEPWYVERFGVDALQPVRVPVSLRPMPVEPSRVSRSKHRAIAVPDGAATIVCATKNAIDAVRLTFETLRECTPESVDVLVADNGSTDGTLEYLRSLDWLEVVPLDRRRAERHAPADVSMHGATLDWLVKQVRTPYVVTMDSDVEFYEPGWLTALMSCARPEKHLAAVGEFEPGIAGYAPRLAPYLLLMRTDVPAMLNISFRGFSYASDPEEVKRLQAIGPRWRMHESELDEFPSLKVYSTGAALFRALQRRGLAWAETPPAVRAMYRHIGHQSWGDHPEDVPGQAEFADADAARREYVRDRLSARPRL